MSDSAIILLLTRFGAQVASSAHCIYTEHQLVAGFNEKKEVFVMLNCFRYQVSYSIYQGIIGQCIFWFLATWIIEMTAPA